MATASGEAKKSRYLQVALVVERAANQSGKNAIIAVTKSA